MELPKELRVHQKARGRAVSSGWGQGVLRTEWRPSGGLQGRLWDLGSTKGDFNPLVRDPLTLSEKVFFRYLLSDSDRPSGLLLGLKLE